MKTYVIAAFYKFVDLVDFELMRTPILEAMKAHTIWGTIILAHEGINGSFAGKPDDVANLYSFLRQDPVYRI